MCLAVYLGSHIALQTWEVAEGELNFRPSSWTPAPLSDYPYVYYLGRQGQADIECSCLLYEHIWFDKDGPRFQPDELMDAAPTDPLERLRSLVQTALRDSPQVGLVCDGEGGVEWDDAASDYERRHIRLSDIRRNAALFSNDDYDWATRAYEIVSETDVQEADA